MIMLIELDRDSRACIERLFRDYPYLHGSIAAIIAGGMGTVFTDSHAAPQVALGVLDFHFLAGNPGHAHAALLLPLLRPGRVMITPTPAWQSWLAASYPGELAPYRREAFQAETFDSELLRRLAQSLPADFELRQIGLKDVPQLVADLHAALVYNFPSHETFIRASIGLGIMHQDRYVAAASAAAIGGGKAEFEIQTHPQFRRRGLAKAVGAALILACLERGLEPCWDAANAPSSALARQLGFRSTGTYDAYTLRPAAGASTTSAA
jgi:GNAT superfamily N-acetyltransferase